MGEPAPETPEEPAAPAKSVARVVEPVDFGEVAIDVSKIILPDKRRIVGWKFEQTKTGEYCRFEIPTTHGVEPVEPGRQGDDVFLDICAEVAAMFNTAQGQVVKARMLALVAAKPMEATNVTVAEVKAEEPAEPAPE